MIAIALCDERSRIGVVTVSIFGDVDVDAAELVDDKIVQSAHPVDEIVLAEQTCVSSIPLCFRDDPHVFCLSLSGTLPQSIEIGQHNPEGIAQFPVLFRRLWDVEIFRSPW